jgi:hypothetical protein
MKMKVHKLIWTEYSKMQILGLLCLALLVYACSMPISYNNAKTSGAEPQSYQPQPNDPQPNLMPFVKNIQLGDGYGTCKPVDHKTLFVHPGTNRPTCFQFDSAAYTQTTGKKTFKVKAAIAPYVPAASVNRGAANVRLFVLHDNKQLAEVVIKVGKPFQREFSATEYAQLDFIIDNNGSPDTDWLLISIK